MMPTECGIKPRAVIHVKPTVVNPYLPSSEPIVHYGVKGQRWGVITKEYEPVTVDHRKTGNHGSGYSSANASGRGIFGGIRSRISQSQAKYRRELAEQSAAQKAAYARQRANKEKFRKYATYGGVALIGLLVAYGSYKYVHGNKMRAYSGLLSRFLERNPMANTNTPEGRAMLKKGIEVARSGSRKLEDALHTNSYLRKSGLQVGKKQAARIYKTRRLMNRVADIPAGTGKYGKILNRYRRNRLQARIFDKLYF